MILRSIYGTNVPARGIYCLGRNYADHAKELGNEVPDQPIVFLKSIASLRGLQAHDHAYPDETFHHEVEVVAVMEQPRALGSVGGWAGVGFLTLGLDLTRREVQSALKAKGHPWTAAKSFAGAAVIADLIPISDFPTRDRLEFSLSVNGTIRQRGTSTDMLHSIPQLVDFLCQSHALSPGDLIYTGTPAGVGPIRRGDLFEMRFEKPELGFSGIL